MKKVFENIIVFLFTRTYLKDLTDSWFKYYWSRVSNKYYSERKRKKLTNQNPLIVFGPYPLINNKYWSESLKKAGYNSKTLVKDLYRINNKNDFDLYYEHVLESHLPSFPLFFKYLFPAHFIIDFILKNADIIVIPFHGYKSDTSIDEAMYYKKFGIISVVIPYGSDYWMYSKVIDNSYKYGLISNYPENAKNEARIRNQVEYWNKNADCVLVCSFIDGASRWDSFPYSILAIDLEKWEAKKNYSPADGTDKAVKVVHTPNHKYVKGTEFIINAVEKLKNEGLKIELILLENVANDNVQKILLEEGDILIEKLTYSVYGLSGLEGMATAMPVISNLENEIATRPYRRYSFLNECPVISATPEDIYETLKFLVKNPAFREEIGLKNRQFVEKYHSYKMFSSFFSKVVEKYWFEKDIDIMHYFHPLNKNSYNNQSSRIEHPMVDNKIPTT